MNPVISCCRKDPSIPLNYAVFLYNAGDKRTAAKQFSQFEQRMKMTKQGQQSLDKEVGAVGYCCVLLIS